MSALLLPLCALILSGASASVAEAAPVELLFARYQGDVDHEPTFVSGAIEVEDLASDKQVTVHYRFQNEGPFSAWQQSEARFVARASETTERWVFETGRAPIHFRGANFEFYVEFRAGEATYRDDRGGVLYRVGSGYLGSDFMWAALGRSRVLWLGGGMNRPDRATLSALVADLGEAKAVAFVYSMDGWATVQAAEARYQYGFGPDAESWFAVIQFPGTPREVEFAVRYTVDGETYWDNNFGQNYRIAGW